MRRQFDQPQKPRQFKLWSWLSLEPGASAARVSPTPAIACWLRSAISF